MEMVGKGDKWREERGRKANKLLLTAPCACMCPIHVWFTHWDSSLIQLVIKVLFSYYESV